MIVKVNKLTKKSFKNYTGPLGNDEFCETNIIFGYNGRGKSSLAEGIVDEYIKGNGDIDGLRFFNRAYINEHMMLEEDKIKGVKANFGKQNIDIEEQIKELNKQKVDIKEEKEKLQNRQEKLQNNAKSTYDSLKGDNSFRFTQIDWSDPLKKLKSDYNNALKIVNDSELTSLSSSDLFIDEINKLKLLNNASFQRLEKEELDKIYTIFQKSYNNVSIPSKELLKWINEGKEFHLKNDDNICLFCGSKISTDNLFKRIEQYNSNETQISRTYLDSIIYKVEEQIKISKNITNNEEFIVKTLGQDILDCINIIKNTSDLLSRFDDILISKTQNMDIIYNASVERLPNDYDDLNNAFDTLTNKINDKVNKLKDNITNVEILSKGFVAKSMLKDNVFISEVNEITKLISEINVKEENNNKIDIKINELKGKKLDIGLFSSFINEILKNLSISFQLLPDEDGYYIKNTNDDAKLSLKDISEGEQNMLALLFFYYELFDDNTQSKIKKEIKLIIIDDPLSSVDDTNRIYILSLIKILIEYKKEDIQFFVFTHVWDDFCEFVYGLDYGDNSRNRAYELIKNEKTSEIKRIDKQCENPYRHCFKELKIFSEKNNTNDLSDCEIYHYPNVMRKVLEEYLKFKANIPSISKKYTIKICEIFCNHKYTEKDKADVAQIINLCNIDSHENVRNPEEILHCAKKLMKYIKDIDPNHYNSFN